MSAKRENEGCSTGSEPPNPGRSGVITKQSRASVPITLRNDSEELGKPWIRRSAGFSRSPARRTAISAASISNLTSSGLLIAHGFAQKVDVMLKVNVLFSATSAFSRFLCVKNGYFQRRGRKDRAEIAEKNLGFPAVFDFLCKAIAHCSFDTVQ